MNQKNVFVEKPVLVAIGKSCELSCMKQKKKKGEKFYYSGARTPALHFLVCKSYNNIFCYHMADSEYGHHGVNHQRCW
jgi:hypothetical protein